MSHGRGKNCDMDGCVLRECQGVQKRVKACLRLLSLESLACSVGSWLVSGNLEFGTVPSIPRSDKNVSLCLNCTNSVVNTEHLLSLWESGILKHAKVEGAHMTKVWGTE